MQPWQSTASRSPDGEPDKLVLEQLCSYSQADRSKPAFLGYKSDHGPVAFRSTQLGAEAYKYFPACIPEPKPRAPIHRTDATKPPSHCQVPLPRFGSILPNEKQIFWLPLPVTSLEACLVARCGGRHFSDKEFAMWLAAEISSDERATGTSCDVVVQLSEALPPGLVQALPPGLVLRGAYIDSLPPLPDQNSKQADGKSVMSPIAPDHAVEKVLQADGKSVMPPIAPDHAVEQVLQSDSKSVMPPIAPDHAVEQVLQADSKSVMPPIAPDHAVEKVLQADSKSVMPPIAPPPGIPLPTELPTTLPFVQDDIGPPPGLPVLPQLQNSSNSLEVPVDRSQFQTRFGPNRSRSRLPEKDPQPAVTVQADPPMEAAPDNEPTTDAVACRKEASLLEDTVKVFAKEPEEEKLSETVQSGDPNAGCNVQIDESVQPDDQIDESVQPVKTLKRWDAKRQPVALDLELAHQESSKATFVLETEVELSKAINADAAEVLNELAHESSMVPPEETLVGPLEVKAPEELADESSAVVSEPSVSEESEELADESPTVAPELSVDEIRSIYRIEPHFASDPTIPRSLRKFASKKLVDERAQEAPVLRGLTRPKSKLEALDHKSAGQAIEKSHSVKSQVSTPEATHPKATPDTEARQLKQKTPVAIEATPEQTPEVVPEPALAADPEATPEPVARSVTRKGSAKKTARKTCAKAPVSTSSAQRTPSKAESLDKSDTTHDTVRPQPETGSGCPIWRWPLLLGAIFVLACVVVMGFPLVKVAGKGRVSPPAGLSYAFSGLSPEASPERVRTQSVASLAKRMDVQVARGRAMAADIRQKQLAKDM